MPSLSSPLDRTILGEYAPMTFPTPQCISKLEWGGFICYDAVFRALTVRPRVENVMTKKALGPIRVSRFDGTTYTVGDESDIFYDRTYGAVGAFPDMCPLVLPNGRYRLLMAVGYEHEIFFTNTLPSRLELRFFSPSAAESILMRLFVPDPFALDVFTGTVKHNASTTLRPTLRNAAGTNQLDPQRVYLRTTFSFSSRLHVAS